MSLILQSHTSEADGRIPSTVKRVENNKDTITTVQQINKLVHTQSLQHLKCMANYGFYLLPVQPLTVTKGLRLHVKHAQATTDFQQIEQWYNQYKDGWWAIATGEKYGLPIIDIDLHGDKDGFKSLRENGLQLFSTFEQRTPNGGLYLGYAYNESVPTKSNIDAGIDTRNNGGFILIAPTKKNGKTYEWIHFPFNKALPDIPKAFIST